MKALGIFENSKKFSIPREKNSLIFLRWKNYICLYRLRGRSQDFKDRYRRMKAVMEEVRMRWVEGGENGVWL